MRIGLNLLYMIPREVGGTETYARGLLDGLRKIGTNHEFILFLNRESKDWKPAVDSGFSSVVCPVNAVSRARRFVYEHMSLRREIRKYRIDLLHSLGYTSPLFLPCPTVVSVPDLNFLAFGSLMTFARRTMLRLAVKEAVLRSDRVITISEFSRREILKTYNVPPEKVVVTYLAADERVAEPVTSQVSDSEAGMEWMGEPYIVAFSATYPNKNIPRLMEAYGEAKRRHAIPQRLVLIGHPFPLKEAGQAELVRMRDVIWTGYLEQRRMLEVVRRAAFMVFPSYYEGFGLPVLEAMAAGLPVVCSRAASLPEVGGDAAVYFDPFSVDDMAEKIASAAIDASLRTTLQSKGIENLNRFSWEKTARETVAVYDEQLRKR
jgi:glycosyltransferase involved in cell wall biosynthesis